MLASMTAAAVNDDGGDADSAFAGNGKSQNDLVFDYTLASVMGVQLHV